MLRSYMIRLLHGTIRRYFKNTIFGVCFGNYRTAIFVLSNNQKQKIMKVYLSSIAWSQKKTKNATHVAHVEPTSDHAMDTTKGFVVGTVLENYRYSDGEEDRVIIKKITQIK